MNSLIFVAFLATLVVGVCGVYCPPGDYSQGCEQCPDDKPWTDCDIDPCVREQEFGCPLHKHEDPKCVSNQCGGCYDEWFLPSGRQVWCWGP